MAKTETRVKLRATRVVVRPEGKKRLDGGQTTRPAMSKAGDVAEYNGDNPAIQIYALGGVLEPVGNDATSWLAKLRAKAKALAVQ